MVKIVNLVDDLESPKIHEMYCLTKV